MTKSFFILLFLLGFAIFYFIVGIISSRKIKNVSDYLFAGRKLSLAQATFGLIAIQLGGGMILGTSQKAYEIGIWGILYTLGMSLGFMLLSFGLASKLNALKIDTVAQLFEDKYKSVTLRKMASILSIVTLFGILIAQIVAAKSLLNTIAGPNELIFLAFWVFVIAYTIIGGLQAVAIIDSIQVIFIIICMLALFAYTIFTQPISFNQLIMLQKESFAIKDSFASLLPILLMPAFFSLIEQDLAQKFFAAKNERTATLASILASLFLLGFSLIPIFFGMYAKYLGLVIPENYSPFVLMVGQITNNAAFALIICAIMAAITSTADSLLCAISSNISQDFKLNFIGFKNQVTRSKFITLIIGAFALIGSYIVKPDIIDILIESYQLSVCCLLVPLLMCILSNKTSKTAAYGAVIAGLAGFVIFKIYPVDYGFLLNLGISFVGYLIGSKLNNLPGYIKKIK